jgi:hypothetical protein
MTSNRLRKLKTQKQVITKEKRVGSKKIENLRRGELKEIGD